MENNIHYTTICLSGGGIKGFSFIGALEYMEEQNKINISEINNWVGTSAGSLVSFILSIDYSIKDLKEFVLDFNFKKLIPDVDIDNLFNHHGIDNGDKIMLIMKNFLKEKLDLDDITFEDHMKITNKKLTIIGTNYSKGIEAVFNHILTPKMSVLLAIRISMSVPIIFTPVLYENDYYIDGGFVNNFPLDQCNPLYTLGIYIKNSVGMKMKDIFTLATGCMGIIADTISRKSCLNNYNVIEIENCDNEVTNFNLDYDKKLKIINLGITFAKKFLENVKIKNNDKECMTDFEPKSLIGEKISRMTDISNNIVKVDSMTQTDFTNH